MAQPQPPQATAGRFVSLRRKHPRRFLSSGRFQRMSVNKKPSAICPSQLNPTSPFPAQYTPNQSHVCSHPQHHLRLPIALHRHLYHGHTSSPPGLPTPGCVRASCAPRCRHLPLRSTIGPPTAAACILRPRLLLCNPGRSELPPRPHNCLQCAASPPCAPEPGPLRGLGLRRGARASRACGLRSHTHGIRQHYHFLLLLLLLLLGHLEP